MGSNVFGNAITDITLMDLPEHRYKTICARERATAALRMRSAEEKDLKARDYVEDLRMDWAKYVEAALPCFAIGDKTCVCVLVYNATGNTLKFVEERNWAGHIGRAPYPLRIENGQWGAFLHVNSLDRVENVDLPNVSGFWGSVARATYRGKNEAGEEIDFNFWWKNFGPGCLSKLDYGAEVSSAGAKPKADYLMSGNPKQQKNWGPCRGIMYEGMMGFVDFPIYELMFTLEHAGS